MRLLKEIRNLLDSYHVKSGIYHYYRGEYGPAAEFFRKALDVDEDLTASDRRVARYYLTMTHTDSARAQENKGDADAAIAAYDHAIEVSPGYPDIRFRFGSLLERVGRHADAVEQYRKAIEINGKYLDAWVSLGFCLLRLERRDESADAFREACTIKLDRTRRPFERGIEMLGAARDVEAAQCFHDAFVFVPKLFEERHRTALARLQQEEYEDALREIDGAIELNPGYPDLYNFRGIALCELGREDEAIEAFTHASSLNSRFMVPRLNLAFALLRAERFKDAESQLESILADDPTEPAARAKLEELQSGRTPDKRRGSNRGMVR